MTDKISLTDLANAVVKRYEVLTAQDFTAPQPDILWTVDGLISDGSLNIFFGEPGCGKTFALFDMAVCVANGAPWLGMSTSAGNVLIIDEDSGRRRLSRRMAEVMRGHEAKTDTPIFAVSLASFDLGNKDDADEVRALIIRHNARLVIIDHLASVMPGRDENSVKDTAPVLHSLRKIADETQAAIIVIHHANKMGGYRGSSAIKGALDLLLSVEKKNGSSHIDFRTEKARDTTSGAFAADMNFINDTFFLSAADIEKVKPVFGKGERHVIRYLSEHGESTIKDISDNAESCSPVTARNCVYALADKAITTRTNGGGQGSGARYDLTAKGRALAEEI